MDTHHFPGRRSATSATSAPCGEPGARAPARISCYWRGEQNRCVPFCQQVTFYDPLRDKTARIDIVAFTEEDYVFDEVKCGLFGRLSENQRAVLAAIADLRAIPMGDRAAEANLIVGVPLALSLPWADPVTTHYNSCE